MSSNWSCDTQCAILKGDSGIQQSKEWLASSIYNNETNKLLLNYDERLQWAFITTTMSDGSMWPESM